MSLPDDWQQFRSRVDLDEYQVRWQRMAEAGQNPHGEADFVCRYSPASVLDAGCGMGRVAIELARRGIDAVGTDLDDDLLARARADAPELTWVLSDLAELSLQRRFDVVVLAGNVVRFVAEASRGAAIERCAQHTKPGGRVIAGFTLGTPTLADYDALCEAAGLTLDDRFATWDGAPYDGGSYAVSVHRSL